MPIIQALSSFRQSMTQWAGWDLPKLAEYKPLAKIEELEECNYNMIDNVLNNEKPKEEKQTGRISIKEKLAEKKAVVEQRGKEVPEKGTEKNSEREM